MNGEIYIIESEISGEKVYEILDRDSKTVAEMIQTGRIDKKEILYSAKLTPINKNKFVAADGI